MLTSEDMLVLGVLPQGFIHTTKIPACWERFTLTAPKHFFCIFIDSNLMTQKLLLFYKQVLSFFLIAFQIECTEDKNNT